MPQRITGLHVAHGWLHVQHALVAELVLLDTVDVEFAGDSGMTRLLTGEKRAGW